jgi:hypothetical protein
MDALQSLILRAHIVPIGLLQSASIVANKNNQNFAPEEVSDSALATKELGADILQSIDYVSESTIDKYLQSQQLTVPSSEKVQRLSLSSDDLSAWEKELTTDIIDQVM